MIDIETRNEEWAQQARENYDTANARRDWATCHAVIADLREKGFEHEADILTKDLFNTQLIVAEKLDKMQEEDEAKEQEDPRDLADRSYPRE